MTRGRNTRTSPRLRPAILMGRRVDFFPAADWKRLCPGWEPGCGWWCDAADGHQILAALIPAQSQCLSALLRARREPWTVSGADAQRAELHRASLWTLNLLPCPDGRADRWRHDQ